MRLFGGVLCLAVFFTACATSPTGRKQLMLVGDQQMDQMGVQAFTQIKGQTPVNRDAATNAYVRCVVDPIIQAAPGQADVSQWEIVVFESSEVNAFALPGGKIGVYTGLLKVAKTPGQLAAVMGHETGHVIAKHGAERVSEQAAEGIGMQAVGVFISGGASSGANQALMAALGLGVQVGVQLPHSRTQESEADVIGEDLMAQAGFDPRESVELWKNMAAASQGKPPEWLSTHPAEENRMAVLQSRMPQAEAIYQKARAEGKNPRCKRPL